MSIKSDYWIKSKCNAKQYNGMIAYKNPDMMIDPFVDCQIKEYKGRKIVSYGLSSYGYDIRCAEEFKIFSPPPGESMPLDPKNFDSTLFSTYKVENICVIPPNSFALARSVEYFRIPRNTLCLCVGKSTYARCGIIVNVTPLEPEWEGYLTIEISNTTPTPVKVYANEGIAQLIFFESNEECVVSYKDKKGKYQGQTGITGSKL
ncbi:Dcd Deoxycytidine deaminase [uncultured Caudovirales phage]|uniref:Dcd Deoxycytidine deaminase n=1 Tax=uncultured Caudovirales phage TaxID=2100421 RepID=A0A6J5KL03_9CAUD|nr:Dcd Deoxycytidine deaminase [uncultured Caudovirales phage]